MKALKRRKQIRKDTNAAQHSKRRKFRNAGILKVWEQRKPLEVKDAGKETC